MTLFEFADALVRYCAAMDASVTSWLRSTAHNRKVGGVPLSAHRFALAADVVYDRDAPPEMRIAIGVRLGLRVIVEGDHDHLQPLDWAKG